jgi:flavin reductase (DIM6/NTAB) family NADH-FMN oxidoreductase RutF
VAGVQGWVVSSFLGVRAAPERSGYRARLGLGVAAACPDLNIVLVPCCFAMCVCCPQASFDPPGITVSVKKDRTLETMLQPGNPFAVSMVPESQAKRVRKVCYASTQQLVGLCCVLYVLLLVKLVAAEVCCNSQLQTILCSQLPCCCTLQIMSTPFTPGADRLANLKTHPSPASGTPVLDTSNAILDCTVVSDRLSITNSNGVAGAHCRHAAQWPV